MQGNEKNENVISLFGAKTAAPEPIADKPQTAEETSFELEVKKNKELADKLKRERQKANQAVLRSYRLKT